MLGQGRAIPRNYYHTVINDAKLDWLNGSQNYNDVIIAATAEAPRKHSFVTEYAGSSNVMVDLLDRPGRFGSSDALAAQSVDWQFVEYMLANGFPLTAQTIGVLQKYIPVPPKLGVPAPQFYQAISYYLSPSFRQQNPSLFAGWTENFQPAQMTADLWQRVVTPTLSAGALFRATNYLTRLYTTLSPEDMDADPVFSYNPGLKDYPNVHNGTLTYHCGIFGDRGILKTAATLRTESGWVVSYPNGTGPTSGSGTGNFVSPGGPSSQRIEVLRETGAPEVIVDNRGSISRALGNGGCGVSFGARASNNVVGLCGLIGLLAFFLLRRRRAN
jgi:MYXO-CTERM domain-containing protein